MTNYLAFLGFATAVTAIAAGLGHSWRRDRERKLFAALRLRTFRDEARGFERELSRARRVDRQLSVVVLDRISPQGASWVERVAYLLIGSIVRELLREHDIVTFDPATDRYVLLLVESKRSEACSLIDRVVREVKARAAIDLSGGAAQLPDDGLTLQDLLRVAGEPSAQAGRVFAGSTQEQAVGSGGGAQTVS